VIQRIEEGFIEVAYPNFCKGVRRYGGGEKNDYRALLNTPGVAVRGGWLVGGMGGRGGMGKSAPDVFGLIMFYVKFIIC